MTSKSNILIVDDDADLRNLIAEFLTGHDYNVSQAASAEEMREKLRNMKFDLVVLDLMMPGEDGLSALRKMKGNGPPIIMLSAMGTDVDRIVGLEMGADDYIPKPCNPRELLARIRAVSRRAGQEAEPAEKLCFGEWVMDLNVHELFAPDGTKITLSPKEWRLLNAIVGAERRVLSRDELMTRLGGEEEDTFDRAIDIAVSRLRRKLARFDKREIIRTVRGEGYGLALEVTSQ